MHARTGRNRNALAELARSRHDPPKPAADSFPPSASVEKKSLPVREGEPAAPALHAPATAVAFAWPSRGPGLAVCLNGELCGLIKWNICDFAVTRPGLASQASVSSSRRSFSSVHSTGEPPVGKTWSTGPSKASGTHISVSSQSHGPGLRRPRAR